MIPSVPDGYEVVQVPVGLAAAIEKVDAFWRDKGSKSGYIECQNDWNVIKYCYDLFCISYPNEAKIFYETQKQLRRELKYESGKMSDDKNVAMRHVANIPQKMFDLIHAFYPNQKWDREFVKKLAKHLPVITVGK